MLVKPQFVEIRWSTSNVDWYQNKGYKFTRYRDSVCVNVDDLMPAARARIKCICDYCGEEYECYYYAYNYGHKKYPKDACAYCAGKKASDISKDRRINKNYKRCVEICEKYGYKIISDKSEFTDVRNNKVRLLCPLHGEFEILIGNLIKGCGCYKCGRNTTKNKLKQCTDSVEEEINSFGGNILQNKEEYINSHTPNLKIRCGKCGSIYTTSLSSYRKTEHCCPNCSVSSRGELLIKEYLDSHNVYYEPQKRFSDCKLKRSLPFDFYLPDHNLAIEFNGNQHYSPVDYFGGYKAFKLRQLSDATKKEYCDLKGIDLVVIRYDDISNIDGILNNKFNFT